MNSKKLKKFKDLLLEEKRNTLDELLSGNETYDCKDEISEDRLTAIPYTLRCVNCMAKYEDKRRREKM